MAETTCPISTDDMKNHLKVDHSVDDTLIEQLMLAATVFAENFQKRTYITRCRTYYLDEFPETIRPPFSPLVAVTSIQYIDTDGVLQELSSSNYRVDTDTEPGRITEVYNCTWPSTRLVTNAVIVTYTSGYGDAGTSTPDEIKAAIKMIVAHLYEHRESVSEITLKEVPQGAKMLIWMRRIL